MNAMSGPQTDVPVGNDGHGETSHVGWQGMTIKDILEKVGLFNVTTLSDDNGPKESNPINMIPDLKDAKNNISPLKPESAFLGPKIWKKPINFYKRAGGNAETRNNGNSQVPRPEFSLMNIDEFLNENNFDFDRISPPLAEDCFGGNRNNMFNETEEHTSRSNEIQEPSSVTTDDSMMDNEQSVTSPIAVEKPQSPSTAFGIKQNFKDSSPHSSAVVWNKSKNDLPKQGANEFLYAESKRARLEREKEERRRRMQVNIEFSAEELSLATIPGADFDPTRRQFSSEELRPQPIIRKRKKTYVAPNGKDERYWEKREKNNVAARRSREARRLKENQIALRTSFLEQENFSLNISLEQSNERNEKLIRERKMLMERLKKYESSMSQHQEVI